MRFTPSLPRKLVVAATVAAALAVPLQVGVAHAGTPEDDLHACLDNAVTTMSDDSGVSTMSDDFTTSVDDCINAFLEELGIDPSLVTTPAPADVTTAPDDSGANTAILGTTDDGTTATDSSSTDDGSAAAAMSA